MFMKMKTNRKVKKLFSYVLTAAMVITAVTPAFAGKVKAVAAGLTLTEQSGWLESAYVEWQPVKNAEGYVAYVKEASASDDAYEKLDDTLIRQYADYWRADALGLKEGSYVMKVTAVLKDGKTVSESTSSLEVEKYDRSGFAFSENSKFQTGSGAYNDDGTLKKDAQVIYVTPETAKTCTAVVNGKEVTGFQSILDAKQSAGTKDTSPLDFRIVGCVTADDVDHFSSSAEGIQMKGKSAYTEMNITIEGVGEDAAVQGFGFLVRNSGNVEFRNFAVMAFMDDGVSLDTKNCNIWVHNMDIFYGSTGGDSDQAKGDGSVDIKGASTNVTVSYVHFWDSGKCSLCGMSDSAEFLVTYHHNWFDHSDSRHPRIRVASVHIYNNYFDGNAKYGVGTTKGSSAFVEANYYRNCKNPMMSSMQGTDALGQGTFSGENGGMIKAYNNITVGASSLIYANSDAGTAKADAVSFDAYLASSREETVPSSYKTVAGATTYNNFDTSSAYDLGVAEEDIDANWYMMCPHEIKNVKGYSLEDFYGEEWEKRYYDCVNDERIDKRVMSVKDMVRLIIKSAAETGTPFAFYRDTVNKMNPNKHAGMIYSSNLCTEIMQNMSPMDIQTTEVINENGDSIIVEKTKAGDFVVCNLSSIVLGNVDVNNDEDVEYVVETQIRAMDNVIDLNYYSVPFAEVTNKKYRAIGLGTSGYHHMLANNKIHWNEEKHLEFADKVYEKINYYAIKASMKIAKEKGAYSCFDGSDWQNGEYFSLRNYDSDKWNDLKSDVRKYGLRNGYLFAVAPNGSTATIAGTSEGVDPVMARFWLEEKKGSIVPKTAPNLSWENFWYYNSAYNIDQQLCIKINGIRQRHIDQGQSFNLYITTEYTMRQIMNLYITACKCGVKSIYYVRSKSLEVAECESCSA